MTDHDATRSEGPTSYYTRLRVLSDARPPPHATAGFKEVTVQRRPAVIFQLSPDPEVITRATDMDRARTVYDIPGLDWDEYTKYRAEYSQELYDLIYEYHDRHGGVYHHAYDIGVSDTCRLAWQLAQAN